ncbi:MAG TPA: hypothetical protein VNO26_09255, partial [Candidatus Limnocylindria bacterium]|nr:hypothetical protein [Candidatus Limnocylindria bacterium]
AAAPAPSGLPQWLTWQRGLLAVWLVVTAALFWTGLGALRVKVSWYLAVDQLGYLLFARDLLAGHFFHHWPPAEALATRLPDPTDVLAQSYIWDGGRLYSRYAPGFPLILALWTGLFGTDAAFELNPLLFLAVLATLIAFVWRTHGSLWIGTIVAALVFLCPTGVTLWALTPTRDLSAHLCALLGLTALAGERALRWRTLLAAGLALGGAASIRPDAVLYFLPAAVLLAARWRAASRHAPAVQLLAAGTLGMLIGLAPSLVYYGAATGNPLRPPQAVELKGFFGPARLDALEQPPAGPRVGFPPAAWRGGELEPVSGEGMKLAYLTATLPANLARLRRLYGDVLLMLTVVGLGVAAVLRPALAGALGVYFTAALLFYSCWGRSYGRYLVSIYLLAPVLIATAVTGLPALVRRLHARGDGNAAGWLAGGGMLLVLAFHAALGPLPNATVQLALTRLVVAATVLGLAAAALWPARPVEDVAAVVLAVVVGLLGSAWLAEPVPRATVQRPEIQRATEVARRTFAPRGVLITTEDIGRPAENYEYWAGVHALYLTDLARWRIPIEEAVFLFLVAEQEPYLLLPRTLPEREQILAGLRAQFAVELVADVPPQRNYDYFVASAFHGGLPLELWRVR